MRRAAALIAQGKLDPSPVHTHTFGMDDLPTALRYVRDKVDGAIKVVVKPQSVNSERAVTDALDAVRAG